MLSLTLGRSKTCVLQRVGVDVGFTRRHLHQCVEEHKNSSSSIGKHIRNKHSLVPEELWCLNEVHEQI